MSKQTLLTLIGFSVPLKYCRCVINFPQLEVEFEFGLGPQEICLPGVADRFCLHMLIFIGDDHNKFACQLWLRTQSQPRTL